EISLIYGGAQIGLMGCIADAVLNNKGKAIGVIPDFLSIKEVKHTALSEMIVVDNMHERKHKMYELADAFIAMPGGFGTLEELFEMLTWGQLGLHQKPIGILNVDGYYNSLLDLLNQMVSSGLLKQNNCDLVLVDSSPEGLLLKMRNYSPPATDKWISDIDQV
ncbi:MAG: TIGR00730 family Rossman fold protein, partial [Flavobacteriales bacterium]